MAADRPSAASSLSVDDLLDRAAISDLFVRYCTALRTKQVDLLDEVFASDGMVDYTSIGGPRAGVGATKEWLAALLDTVEWFDLMIGDSEFVITADRTSAAVVTTWHGLFVPKEGPALQVYGHYQDRLVRGEHWRIAERIDCPGRQVVAATGGE